MNLHNKVIKVLNPKHGQKVRDFFILSGYNCFSQHFQFDSKEFPYYGFIGDEFGCYDEAALLKGCPEIIELPDTVTVSSKLNIPNASIYEISELLRLNSYEFEILKLVTKCRVNGNFKKDLTEAKEIIDTYMQNFSI